MIDFSLAASKALLETARVFAAREIRPVASNTTGRDIPEEICKKAHQLGLSTRIFPSLRRQGMSFVEHYLVTEAMNYE